MGNHLASDLKIVLWELICTLDWQYFLQLLEPSSSSSI
ncbi:hypothetical protein NSP_30950 [Nodularia spumigena CCY9414]|nr:hypothetical protein NSP_27180 [Nodularia spumigena CCY9414]AHJ29422.1 hypothetical protein NSP_30950 [Nodularia spumigena CCY9414]